MKKNKNYRSKKQVARNAKRAEKAKIRIKSRIVSQPELIKVQEHGPSETVTFDKDGKVKNWNSRSAHNHVKHSKEAIQARSDNRLAKENKKNRIKTILKEAGYDPTISYTRKEKKKFTRAVKAKLYAKPTKPWSKEEAMKRIEIRAKAKKERLAALPHVNEIKKQMEAILPQKVKTGNKPIPKNERYLEYLKKLGVQNRKSAAQMQMKEKAKSRKFIYSVERVREEDLKAQKEGRPFRTYDFYTHNFMANTVKEAEKRVAKLFEKWEKDTSFTGIVLRDPDGERMTTYYTREKIKRLAA